MVKKAVQRGRSKRGGEAYSIRYVEPPSAARTKLADFFNILLGSFRTFSPFTPRWALWSSLFITRGRLCEIL